MVIRIPLVLVLIWPFCSAEQNHFSNFGRGSSKEHCCEIILNRPICLGADVV